MTSRLLTRLDADIRGASTPAIADALRCERAAYHARRGDPDTAARELRAVRERHRAAPRLSIYAWLNLAEGLSDPQGGDACVARAKVERAHALAQAAGRHALRALASAWLSAFDLRDDCLPDMGRHLAEALALAGASAYGTKARAALVAAEGYDLAGRPDLARPWHARAHWHATAEGDDAALSAQLWTMARMRVAAARGLATPAAHPPDSPARHARRAFDSARRYDRWCGIRRPAAVEAMCSAQLRFLAGDFGSARTLYEAHLVPASGHGLQPQAGPLLADRAWCRLQAGEVAAAETDACAAADLLMLPGRCAGRAPAHDLLAQAFDTWGNTWAASRQRELAARARVEHRAAQQRLQQILDAVIGSVPDWGFEPDAGGRITPVEQQRA